ncbi:MAG: ABC transporter permease subunit [Thermofilum sp.]|jgi:peptide/nickel transport system permease protein|nr:ABC transporter permease subunit [Thermofilum sp.]
MSATTRYLIERFTIYLLTVYISFTIVFVLPRLVPGDPLTIYYARLRDIGSVQGVEQMIEEYRKMLGLDKDLFTQYVSYIRSLLRGDLGYSIGNFPAKVSDMIADALPWSIGLLSVTTILSWLIGTLLGAISGWRGGRLSRIFSIGALFLSNLPYYVLAIILVFVFAYTLRWFPSTGGYSVGMTPRLSIDFILNVIWHSVLPALSIILSSLAWWYLSMRSMVATVKGEDFVVFAEAKGLPQKDIMWNYGVRNAILPQVTGLALEMSRIFAGALVTEVIFGYPGLGTLIVTGLRTLDYFLIQGTILLSIFAVATATFLVELIYPLLDPRIRYGGG